MVIRRGITAFIIFISLSLPARSDTILQAFWWDCQNEASYAPGKTYKYEWYNYIRAQLPRLEAIGVTALWTPPPLKAGNSAGGSMGYDVYDHYDLGEKPYNQPKEKPEGGTRFGTRDELLRLVSSAHAHGIGIYPDIVLNHMSGGREDTSSPKVDAAGHEAGNRWKTFRYGAAGGSEAGRWPKGWWNFHPNPDHNSINSDGIDWEMWGPDICYASNHDADGKPCKDYMLGQVVDWLEWFSKVTGVDGYRFDAVRHYESRVVRDILAREEKCRGYRPFAVGEYGLLSPDDLDRWVGEVEGRSSTFDFPLHDQLYKMVFARGFYNLGALPDFLQKDGKHSVPFVNSHDTVRGPAGNTTTIPPGDPWAGVAYAFILSLDRTPSVFYEDLFPNRSVEERRFGDPVKRPMRKWLADLIEIRERYASGSVPALFPLRSDDLLAIERPGKMVTIINDNGVDWKEASFTSQFGPGVELKDITGQTNARITTGTGQNAGKISVWIPHCSYVVLVKASEPPLSSLKRQPRRTVQEMEFADDLSTGSLNSKGWRTFRIWPASGSEINARLKFTDKSTPKLLLVGPDGKPRKAKTKFNGQTGTWKAGVAGWYTFKARINENKKMKAFLKVDYLGAK